MPDPDDFRNRNIQIRTHAVNVIFTDSQWLRAAQADEYIEDNYDKQTAINASECIKTYYPELSGWDDIALAYSWSQYCYDMCHLTDRSGPDSRSSGFITFLYLCQKHVQTNGLFITPDLGSTATIEILERGVGSKIESN